MSHDERIHSCSKFTVICTAVLSSCFVKRFLEGLEPATVRSAVMYCTGQAITHELKFWSAPPLFLEDEDIFQKSASMVPLLFQFPVVPWRPIFELHL